MQFTIDGDILIVSVDGSWTRVDGEFAQEKAAALMFEQDLTRVLIDIRRAEVNVSLTDIFEKTSTLFERFPPEAKHAVVYTEEDNLQKNVVFFENVAINRGIQARAFTDYESAKKWLSG